MVTQFDGDDEELLDHERFPSEQFPRPAEPPPPPEFVVQIRLASSVALDPTPIEVLIRTFGTTTSTEGSLPALSDPFGQLRALLTTLGGLKIAWPLDVSPERAQTLTQEELRERRAILDITFGPQVDLRHVLAAIRELPFVEEAEPLPDEAPPWSHGDEPLLGEDDQNLSKQWYVFRVRADRAWAYATGQDVVIADVDYGFRPTHQDLTNIDPSKAFNAHDGSKVVNHGQRRSHGTAVLGIAGGARNGHGVIGIAFEATLWPIQANSGPGPGLGGDKWARGIERVYMTDSQNRRKVVILENQTSTGGCWEMVASTRTVINEAITRGVVVVTAAGNGNRDVKLTEYGNTYEETGSILVGATSFHQRLNPRASSSNYGPRITVSAPGYGPSDLSCGHKADNNYRLSFGGTSGAAPKVAAACALMLQMNESLTHNDVKNILLRTGSEVVTCPNREAGVFLDVEAAVIMAR